MQKTSVFDAIQVLVTVLEVGASEIKWNREQLLGSSITGNFQKTVKDHISLNSVGKAVSIPILWTWTVYNPNSASKIF